MGDTDLEVIPMEMISQSGGVGWKLRREGTDREGGRGGELKFHGLGLLRGSAT